jgi:hypothetical protein
MIVFSKQLTAVWAFSAATILMAQQPGGQAPAAAPSADELAKQTQNPIASLISVPFQSNFDMGLGPRRDTGTSVLFQPVIPFAITPDWNVILRVVVPMLSQPLPDGSQVGGTGDTLTSVFFSPSKPGKVIWGLGPAFTLPSATDKRLGSEKFSVGPTAVALIQPGKLTIGMLWNHQWSVSGAVDRASINQDYLQPLRTITSDADSLWASAWRLPGS